MRLFLYEKWYTNAKMTPDGFSAKLQSLLGEVPYSEKKDFEILSTRVFAGCGREAEPDGSTIIWREFDVAGDRKRACEVLLKVAEESVQHYDATSDFPVKTNGNGHVILEPLARPIWFNFDKEKRALESQNGVLLSRFLEYELWRVHPSVDMSDYESMVDTWFRYVVENKEELFPEWVSGSYFTQLNHDGSPNGVFVMLFEYDSLEGHHAYKSRKLHSYAINDGRYAQYAANDPYQFFDLSTVRIDCWSEDAIV